MDYTSVPTKGRTLDYAAGVYDILEPWVMFGKQNQINRQVVEFLDIKAWNKINGFTYCPRLSMVVVSTPDWGKYQRSAAVGY